MRRCRVTAGLLSLALVCSLWPGEVQADGQEAAGAHVSAGSYAAYLEKRPDAGRAGQEITISPDMAEGGTVGSFEGKPGVKADAGQTTTWRFSVEAEGYYNLEIAYLAVDGNGGSMERDLYLDGAVPFNEARGILLKREYAYDAEKTYGSTGDQIQPDKTEIRQWRKRTVTSPSGYIADELRFYLTPGQHTLSLEAVREPVIYGDLRFYRQEEPPAYAEIKRGYEEKGYSIADTSGVYIPAESPSSVSDFSVYPTTDRTSAYTEPSSEKQRLLNVIGGESWASAGQFIRYTFQVEKSGLYALAFRFKQDISQGLSVYRKLWINGELPFREAASLAFTYDSGWQTTRAGNGNGAYWFYFEEGKPYELTLEVTCGEYVDVLSALNESLTALNGIYRRILMITGPDPDVYRDYHFKSLIPEVIEQMRREKERLESAGRRIAKLSDSTGATVTAIGNLVTQLKQMGEKPEKFIASGLATFQSNISALGTWIMNATSQPLMLDSLQIEGKKAEPLPADTGFFRTVIYEFGRFLSSFVNDYRAGDASGEEAIDVWIYTGRDQAQIVRNLIDNQFVGREGIGVNLKLVAAGTLMPATLAGKGPDVTLGSTSTEPINLAIRNAVLDLTEFPDCQEVFSRFHESALTPFTFRDAVYALPETQSFLMMFYRTDILQELGLKPPDTWDELFDCMLELQTNNLNVGLPTVYHGFLMFLTQQGGSLYSKDARTSLLGSDVALSSFKTLTDFYILYGFPITYDFANRFRSGEMPIAIQEYTAYNQLVLFAPEIKGLWKMRPIPGTRSGDTVNRSSVGTVTGAAIMKQTEQKEPCWEFLKWWTSQEIQSEFGMRMESVLGESAKYATANMAAMTGYSWTHSDLEALQEQWKSVTGVPEVPGGYYSSRYVEFAFNKVVNQSADAVQTLENYVPTITAELQRKLKEFGY